MAKHTPKLTKYQTFTPRRIRRSQMEFMPGNPQDMNQQQSEALGSVIDVDNGGVGLLETIVWNKKTGHIVGGNHRVMEIDAKEGYDAATKANDYEIDVAEIDVDSEREKAIVVLLNNPRLQGRPKAELLRDFLINMDEAEHDNTGFTSDDVSFLLGDAVIEESEGVPDGIASMLFGSHVKVTPGATGEAPDFQPTSADDQGNLSKLPATKKVTCPKCSHEFET